MDLSRSLVVPVEPFLVSNKFLVGSVGPLLVVDRPLLGPDRSVLGSNVAISGPGGALLDSFLDVDNLKSSLRGSSAHGVKISRKRSAKRVFTKERVFESISNNRKRVFLHS